MINYTTTHGFSNAFRGDILPVDRHQVIPASADCDFTFCVDEIKYHDSSLNSQMPVPFFGTPCVMYCSSILLFALSFCVRCDGVYLTVNGHMHLSV